ncbi:glycosyltransferase family 2 protein [Seonamhaeicola algicola]|uniref:Glycosyltransferase family 2 protein n=1 Tax=Seonamhaeicola algicola TaxID=1719036 RepID=A0A5C7ATH2_9FLAO|nr:glycosyltransferase family 2 protein [Seonamhaeicola algicola]TXE12036.1 glycosyltransferase family 2 protein [Seonamhaeicola algicola]
MEGKVSIIMATYNRAHFIEETLSSIKKQTYTNWECLIIDDGGSDNTEEIITPIINKDKRFKFFKRTDEYLKGLPGCRNYGLNLAKGDYIIFFDDDDIVHPQNLEICISELSGKKTSFCRYERSVFFESFNYEFDLSKEYEVFNIGKADVDKLITNELPFNSCAVMWKKECFNSHRFVESLMYAEEWELYSRILSAGFEGISVKKELFYGRKHQKSNTGEFYQGNTVRINSKKEAIRLVIYNLYKKELLTPYLFKYLINLAISFRDYNLVRQVLNNLDLKINTKLFYKIKYSLYPLWIKYKKTCRN